MEANINMDAVVDHYTLVGDEIYFSFPLINKLLTEYKVNGTQVVMYLCVADYLIGHKDQEDGNAITLDYIAATTGINKTTVFANMKVLEEKQLIKRWIPQNSNRRTTRYDFKVIV